MRRGRPPRWTAASAVLAFATGAVVVVLTAALAAESRDTGGNPFNGTGPIVVASVDVIPMVGERQILENHSVLIESGMIVEVGPASEVDAPPGSRIVDGRNAYLIPGLVDMHVHPLATDELRAYLRHGVTSILVMRGRQRFLDWRDSVNRGQLQGPTMYVVGPTTDGFPPLGWKFVGVPDAKTARCVVKDQARRGYDAIKVYNQYGEAAFAALNEAADEARMPVVGHIPRALGAIRALDLGQDMIAHGEEYYFADFRQEDDRPDMSLLPSLVDATRRSGARVTPMLSSTPAIIRLVEDPEAVVAAPEMRYASAATYHAYKPENNGYTNRPDPKAFVARNRLMYAFLQEFTDSLAAAGVPLLAGTDAGVVGLPGVQLHRELEELVGAGLSPYQALRTATVEPGRFAREELGATGPFGTIEVGARADLVLLASNPLEAIGNIENVRGVMARGVWFPIQLLEAAMDSIAARGVEQHRVLDRFDSLASSGRLEEAVALGRQAQRLSGSDPLFHESVIRRHAVAAFERDPDGMIEMLRFAVEIYPDFHAMHNTLAAAFLARGDTVEAVVSLEESLRLSACNGVAKAMLEELRP